ncbi:uncharacterized protein [Euwallacea fornicatus]|uniref:uncharacterized protein n=1 Tax=Euwallacea fornicatus TaxID=995702 RepID=UPI00338E8875
MQRILSVETSRNVNQPTSEFVTKRFCWSFLLTVTFFAILGGFLLGKFISDRTIDDMKREVNDISRKVEILNKNFQTSFPNGLNMSVSHEYPFLKCNFVLVGRNKSGHLRSAVYLENLIECFNNS